MTTLAPRTPLHEFLDRCEQLVGQGPARLLGVGGDADPTAVRAAFRALARRFHPDAALGAGPEDRERLQAAFARLTEAYHALGGDRAQGTGPAPREAPAARSKPSPVPAAIPVARRAAALAPSPAGPKLPGAPRLDPGERRDRVRTAIEQAQALVVRGDSEEAVRVLHQIVTLALGPQQREIRLLLARAYLADSRWRRYGVALVREMAQEEPPCAEALALLGGVYRGQGLLARAEATLLRALALDPENPEARSGLRAVRAALAASRVPDPVTAPPGLLARLFSLRR